MKKNNLILFIILIFSLSGSIQATPTRDILGALRAHMIDTYGSSEDLLNGVNHENYDVLWVTQENAIALVVGMKVLIKMTNGLHNTGIVIAVHLSFYKNCGSPTFLVYTEVEVLMKDGDTQKISINSLAKDEIDMPYRGEPQIGIIYDGSLNLSLLK